MRRLIIWLVLICLAGTYGSLTSAYVPEQPQQDRPWKMHFPIFFGANNDVVYPVKVASISGQVQHAEALLRAGTGAAVLTVVPGGPPATLVLDYGKLVGGVPFLTVSTVLPEGAATVYQA